MYRILVINPGSTSSKIAVFTDEAEVYSINIAHTLAELAPYPRVANQHSLRRDAVFRALSEAAIAIGHLDAVVGRGGMLRPIPSGVYRVNQRMLDDLQRPGGREHISNLGAPIAYEIASAAGIPAFIVDPVVVDEFEPLARVAGLPDCVRRSEGHMLSLKAAARWAAQELGRAHDEINLVVAHLGSGISVSAHRRAAVVDINCGLDGAGPFSPERAGGLPVGEVMRLAFSGQYTHDELYQLVTRRAGLVAYLGTNDAREVERRIARGDERARLIYEAMAYQIAKEIGLMSTVLRGDVQAIVLTGGLAPSRMLVGWISERVAWIAPLLIYPGEFEMSAMAQGALRVLRGEEEAKEY